MSEPVHGHVDSDYAYTYSALSVFWPESEFQALIARWPQLADHLGATWDEHRRRVERHCALCERNGLRVEQLPADVPGFEAFLADRRRAFDLPIDLSDRPAWDQAVLRAVCDVPWGTVASYAQIARAVDRPGAARAAGGAISRSPIGIIVPCHRVITADGSLGGYGVDGYGSRLDHLRLKRELLLREGIDIPLPAP